MFVERNQSENIRHSNLKVVFAQFRFDQKLRRRSNSNCMYYIRKVKRDGEEEAVSILREERGNKNCL